jgi:16S rRNA (guanine966-N2)-methyltransferase
MRVVGGDLGGRVLKAPAGDATRPTSEKVRQAIFNILPDVEGMEVLDLFAGSGALGIEALSRRAERVTFVDKAKPALAALRANLKELQLDDRATVLAGDSVVLAARHVPPRPYQLVFLDPPYRSDLAVRAATVLQHLSDDAIVVIEHDRRNAPPETLGSLLRTDERRYGDTLVSFYRVRR